MRQCTACQRLLALTDFPRDKKQPDGLHLQCRECKRKAHKSWRDRNKEHLKEYRERTKSKRNARRRELYASDPERRAKACAAARAYRAAHPRYRKKQALSKYNLPIEEYDRMVKEQRGKCAICGQEQTTKSRLFVDHDHNTGKVRGLLCDCCNFGIGHFQDDPLLLEIAIEYLRGHNG